MARFGGPWTTGRWGAEGLTRLVGKLLSGSGVLASGDLLVSAQTTPDMTVKVTAGDTAVMDGAIVRHGWSTGNENVNIASNATGVTKTDVVVAYLDASAASTTENNPNSLVLASVRKPTGTGVPSGAEIIGVIGSKPYTILAEVTVANGVSSINSGNIVDRRVQTRLTPNNATITSSNDAAPGTAQTIVATTGNWYDMDDMSLDLTTGGGDVAVDYQSLITTSIATDFSIGVLVDGVFKGKTYNGGGTAGKTFNGHWLLKNVAAGLHTIKLQVAVASNATVSNYPQRAFSVMEFKR